MDAEQIRAEMNATRQRIDRKLDVLQMRVSEASGQALRVAGVVSGALAVTAILFAALRSRRRRRYMSRGWA